MRDAFLCADFGSTWTKVHLVAAGGDLLGFATHCTTIDTDLMHGFDACVAELSVRHPEAATAEVLACSSAGGGLRVAVVGAELLVTAEAGQRVALSSGGRIVHVVAGTSWDFHALSAAAPDLILLVGGTDGGNSEVAIANAQALAEQRWRGPVVVACNSEAQSEIKERLERARIPVSLAPNVLPRIGKLDAEGARAAIRAAFLRKVIGGKRLSEDRRFTQIVRGATPDLVLLAIELLSLGRDDLGLTGTGDLAAVDIGGATTDVYSVLETDAEQTGLALDVVGSTSASRSVEGDLGMRWSAATTVKAAADAGLIEPLDAERTALAVERLEANPSVLSDTESSRALDSWLASLGIALGLRRHAGRSRVVIGEGGRVVERSGRDLREVSILIGSGGAVRHAPDANRLVRRFASPDGGWQLPESPRVVVDHQAVLAAAGLLSVEQPETAYRLMTSEISRLEPA